MAGDTGFEPVNDGVKVRCLTAWRIPNKMGRLMGFEPTHEGVTVLCLNHLTTVATTFENKHLMVRPKGLEPLTPALEGRCSIQLSYERTLVGVAGFEPAALWSQTRCATKLRYTPLFTDEFYYT